MRATGTILGCAPSASSHIEGRLSPMSSTVHPRGSPLTNVFQGGYLKIKAAAGVRGYPRPRRGMIRVSTMPECALVCEEISRLKDIAPLY